MIIHSENRFVKYFFLTTLFFYFSSSMNLKDPLFCLFYKCNRLSCDCKLLVGRDHTDFYFGICCGDHFFLSVYFVCLCIYCNSKISKILKYLCSDDRCIFSDTCSKCNRIHTIHCCHICTDIFCNGSRIRQ